MLTPFWSCFLYRMTIMNAKNHFANRNQTILFFQPRFDNIDINSRNSRWLHIDKGLYHVRYLVREWHCPPMFPYTWKALYTFGNWNTLFVSILYNVADKYHKTNQFQVSIASVFNILPKILSGYVHFRKNNLHLGISYHSNASQM